MTPFFVAIFLLGLSSLATAANFNQVYEWPEELNYEWPSEESRARALADVTFKPAKLYPIYMAVYESRIFFSLYRYNRYIPATLVSLPTSSASSAPPLLTPFPSLEMNGEKNCNQIGEATGLQVDSVGRLWVLDGGSKKCNSKLWTIDLKNNDQTKLVHEFSFQKWTHDLVLDETPNGTFAYIALWVKKHIVVFSLEKNESWTVETPDIMVYSIALSPKTDQEPRQLYIGKYNSTELYSISVDTLRNGNLTANPELVGNWTAIDSYSMVMDNQGTMFTAFSRKNFLSSWKTSQPFQEQRFHEVAGLEYVWPFTFTFDQSGTLWMTVFDDKSKPRCRLLKAAVGAKSSQASPDGASGKEEYVAERRILIDSSVFFVFLLAFAIL
ncbi:protein yellow-like isoform X1 [Cloeon dipterum]|uniref:protein yellow-like isoform X1 n=1 Tax=Cloeon dipterum TaxID=197152 RepID=UPI00322098FC